MIKPEEITEDFLKKYDGVLVWIRWDYLCMRGYASGETLKLLDKVAELKATMELAGYVFTA